MGDASSEPVFELLALAASSVLPAPGRRPWEYGWGFADYRHSEQAALHGTQGPVTLNNDGIVALEGAAEILLREQKIKERWDLTQFWGILASMVVAVSQAGDNREARIAENVTTLRTVGQTLIVDLIANVTWQRPPISFGEIIIGDANEEFVELVNSSAGQRISISDELKAKWLDEDIRPRIPDDGDNVPVAAACWTPGQAMLSTRETRRVIQDLIDLTILLEHDLEGRQVFRRGPTNRPGIRGHTLDRDAIGRGLTGSARSELVAIPLSISPMGKMGGASWFGAEPLPLGEMLSEQDLLDGVIACLKQGSIPDRIRVAARWFSEAQYTMASDDAALALGVAMDSIIGGKNAMSGSAMADRFALLEPDPSKRRNLIAEYLKFYGVRSSVAHGGRSRNLDKPEFLNGYYQSVQWAAWRMLAVGETFKVSTDAEIDDLYNDLRLGVRAWP